MINRSRGVGAKSSNEDIFFSLWFHLINLHCSEVSVYRDNQSITNKEKIDRTDALNTDGEAKKKMDKADISDTGKINAEEVDRVDPPDISRADIKEVEEANGSSIGRVDAGEADRADVSKVDIKKAENPGTTVEDPNMEDNPWRPVVAEQVVARRAVVAR